MTHPQSPASPLPEAAEPVAPTMTDALEAGDGTLHGAIDYWQGRALAAEAARDTDETNKVLADNYLELTAQAPAQAGEVAPDYSEMSREQLERHAVRMAQLLTNDRAIRFYDKHAFGPLAAPSCLCCGRLPDKVAIKHMELPGIVICQSCRDKALTTPPAQPVLAPMVREPLTADELLLWMRIPVDAKGECPLDGHQRSLFMARGVERACAEAWGITLAAHGIQATTGEQSHG